jgi:hypothetical protein
MLHDVVADVNVRLRRAGRIRAGLLEHHDLGLFRVPADGCGPFGVTAGRGALQLSVMSGKSLMAASAAGAVVACGHQRHQRGEPCLPRSMPYSPSVAPSEELLSDTARDALSVVAFTRETTVISMPESRDWPRFGCRSLAPAT